LHDTVDALSGYPVDFITDYEAEGIKLFEFMQNFLKTLMTANPDIETVKTMQITQKIISVEAFDKKKAEILAENFLIRRKDVQNYISNKILSENSLATFNWSISLVLSSSNMANIKEPVLHLQLNTFHDYSLAETILEFNYTELSDFLEQINNLKDRCSGY
jgi:COMM domain